MDNGTNIEYTEVMKTIWKAIQPIISPPDTTALNFSVANATKFRINHNNNNYNNQKKHNITKIINNYR